MGAEIGTGRLVVVSGPSRGGKSRWAEHLAAQDGRPVLYVATGRPASADDDPSWQARVEAHRHRRPGGWHGIEPGAELELALEERLHPGHAQADHLLLIDSLGSWLAWHLDKDGPQWQQRCERLITALCHSGPPVLVVVEETGWGVVPPTAIGGLFRDRLGALHQELMRHCGAAWLVIGGRAVDLLAISQPVPAP